MYQTITTSDGITYTQDGPAVLTGDRTLLVMEGPRRISATLTLVDVLTGSTVCTYNNAIPLSLAGGNKIVFDLTDGLRSMTESEERAYTLTISPRMVAPGTIGNWQTLTNVVLNYYVRPGRTLTDRSYSSASVIPVVPGYYIEYYFPGDHTGFLRGTANSFSAIKRWNKIAWNNVSTWLDIKANDSNDFLRGNLADGYDNVKKWSVKLWIQSPPACVPYVALRWISHDGCSRAVFAEIDSRETSAEGLEWHSVGAIRNNAEQYITRARLDYPLIVRNVPVGCDLSEMVISDYVFVRPYGGQEIRVAIKDLTWVDNLYKKRDYKITVTTQW